MIIRETAIRERCDAMSSGKVKRVRDTLQDTRSDSIRKVVDVNVVAVVVVFFV